MEETNKRALGKQMEEKAVQYIQSLGATVLCTNYYFYGGELDIIAKEQEYLCFIEVKYRRNTKLGFPEEAINLKKQRKILQGAKVYLYRNGLSEETPCRFDVISILNQEITWIKNAF